MWLIGHSLIYLSMRVLLVYRKILFKSSTLKDTRDSRNLIEILKSFQRGRGKGSS